jgi:hypothetical protein
VTVLGNRDGKYWVQDPNNGEISRVSLEDLTKGLSTVVYQTRNVETPPPDFMHNQAWDKPGGGGPTSGGTGGSGGGSGGSAG